MKRRKGASKNYRKIRNDRISGFTPKQLKAVELVCHERHVLHTKEDLMWKGYATSCWDLLPSETKPGILNEHLQDAGLDPIDFESWTSHAIVDTWNQLSEEEKSVWQLRADLDHHRNGDAYDYWYSYAHQETLQYLESCNRKMETYLKNIDEEKGTTFCPNHSARLYVGSVGSSASVDLALS